MKEKACAVMSQLSSSDKSSYECMVEALCVARSKH